MAIFITFFPESFIALPNLEVECFGLFFCQHGINTILNPRGDIATRELKKKKFLHSFQALNAFIDRYLRHESYPSKNETLISTMQHIQKPHLIHCNHGAKRTGFASTLYLAEISRKVNGHRNSSPLLIMSIFAFAASNIMPCIKLRMMMKYSLDFNKQLIDFS